MEYAGHVNVYVCPIGHETVTQNLADGVTPFMIGCRGAVGTCDEMAYSSFYRVDQSLRPSYVWEKINPSFEECRALCKREARARAKEWTDEDWDSMTEQMLEHYKKGGLHLRQATVYDLEVFGKGPRR